MMGVQTQGMSSCHDAIKAPHLVAGRAAQSNCLMAIVVLLRPSQLWFFDDGGGTH